VELIANARRRYLNRSLLESLFRAERTILGTFYPYNHPGPFAVPCAWEFAATELLCESWSSMIYYLRSPRNLQADASKHWQNASGRAQTAC